MREARARRQPAADPRGHPLRVAALCEPLAVAMHGVNRAEVKPGDKVVVFGCGPIGLGMVLWLVDRGVTDVVALDLAQERLDRALALGARAAIDPAQGRRAREAGRAPRRGAVLQPATASAPMPIIDAAGAPNILTDVIMMAKFHARLVDHRRLHEAGRVPGRAHADQRDDDHHRGRLSDRDARRDRRDAAAARTRSPSLISHRLPFDAGARRAQDRGDAEIGEGDDPVREAPAHERDQDAPQLADLVRSGDAQTEAERDHRRSCSWRSDVSNAYLVTTSDGDVMINTGIPDGGERSKAPVRAAPHRAAALHHPDAEPRRSFRRRRQLSGAGHQDRRRAELQRDARRHAAAAAVLRPAHLQAVGLDAEARHAAEAGSAASQARHPRRPDADASKSASGPSKLICAPEGETIDNIARLDARRRRSSSPATPSARCGCRCRSSTRCAATSRGWCATISSRWRRVRDLGAEIVITGHGEPIRGADRIRADLDKMHAAVSLCARLHARRA